METPDEREQILLANLIVAYLLMRREMTPFAREVILERQRMQYESPLEAEPE